MKLCLFFLLTFSASLAEDSTPPEKTPTSFIKKSPEDDPADDSKSSIEKSTPSAEDSKSSLEKSTPPAEDSKSSIEKSTPHAEDSKSSIEKSTPPAEDSESSIEKFTPPADDSESSIEKSKPPEENSESSTVNPTPAMDFKPSTETSTSSEKDSTTPTENSESPTVDSTFTVENSAPSAEDSTASAEDSAAAEDSEAASEDPEESEDKASESSEENSGSDKAYSYQVNIKIMKPHTGTVENCCGSILDKRWIVTAASCLKDLGYPNYLIIVVNSKDYLGVGGTTYDEKSHIIHPNYVPNYPQNNIALIRLNKDIKFDEKYRAVSWGVDDFDNVTATLSSWTQTTLHHTIPAPKLKYTKLPVLSEEDCRQELIQVLERVKFAPKDYMYFLSLLLNLSKFVCTGPDSKGVSHCQDDPGSPLVVNRDLIGLAHSSGVCRGQPGTYTRVSTFRRWIMNEMIKYDD